MERMSWGMGRAVGNSPLGITMREEGFHLKNLVRHQHLSLTSGYKFLCHFSWIYSYRPSLKSTPFYLSFFPNILETQDNGVG